MVAVIKHWREIHPSTDSWTATSTNNAPAGPILSHGSMDRQRNDCLGRRHSSSIVNTGGRYNPEHGQLDGHQHHQRTQSTVLSHGSLDRQ